MKKKAPVMIAEKRMLTCLRMSAELVLLYSLVYSSLSCSQLL